MAKRLLFIGLFLLACQVVQAENLTQTEIFKSYQKSYEFEKRYQYPEAIQDLKPVYIKYSKTYTVNYRLGWLYYLNKNYANALNHLTTASAVVPSSVEVVIVQLLIYTAKADWDKVEEYAVKVMKTDYYNITANYWYAYTLKMQGKYNLSIQAATKMLNVYPTSVLFLQLVGEGYYLDQQIEESRQVFENIKILDPTNQTADYYLKN